MFLTSFTVDKRRMGFLCDSRVPFLALKECEAAVVGIKLTKRVGFTQLLRFFNVCCYYETSKFQNYSVQIYQVLLKTVKYALIQINTRIFR